MQYQTARNSSDEIREELKEGFHRFNIFIRD